MDIKCLGMSLQLHWLWLQHTDPARPWNGLSMKENIVASAFFKASTRYVAGNGLNTFFWSDPWINGKCIQDLAPELWAVVLGRKHNRHTMVEALDNNT
jgi:hypothetical protein